MTLLRPIAPAALLLFAALAARAQAPAPESAAPQAEPPEIERLFRQLSDADPTTSARLERRIAQLWSRSGSDSMDYLLRRGREAMEDEAYDRAIDHFTALVELAPDFAEGWNGRATAHFLADEYWRSVADIQRALALEPRHFGALTGLISIFERVGDEAGALKAARAALEVHPNLRPAQDAVERLGPKVDGRGI